MAGSKRKGQATTEYLFLLLIAFVLFRILQQSLGPIAARYAEGWARGLETRFSKGLHRIR